MSRVFRLALLADIGVHAGIEGEFVQLLDILKRIEGDILLLDSLKSGIANPTKCLANGGIAVEVGADRYRTQEKNRDEALKRLAELIRKAVVVQKKRKPTRPSKASQQKRMNSKTRHGKTKNLRKKVSFDD